MTQLQSKSTPALRSRTNYSHNWASPKKCRPALLSLLEAPTAILTIENYASFNRQVREIEDGSLVVYTGGFPAAGAIELLSKILTGVPAEVPSRRTAKCYSGCPPNEVHTGLAAARTLHVEKDAPGFHHRMKRDVGDFLLMEHELHQRLLHGLFLVRPLSGSWDMEGVGTQRR
jgi:Uncharacterized protein conserved in bacteria C-term(DUF2220)